MNAVLAWIAAAIGDVSPKVRSGLNWGVLAALALALADSATPDTFAGLGPWGPVVSGLVPVVAGQVAAWCKTDPLRDAGKAAVALEPADPNPPKHSAADPAPTTEEQTNGN